MYNNSDSSGPLPSYHRQEIETYLMKVAISHGSGIKLLKGGDLAAETFPQAIVSLLVYSMMSASEGLLTRERPMHRSRHL